MYVCAAVESQWEAIAILLYSPEEHGQQRAKQKKNQAPLSCSVTEQDHNAGSEIKDGRESPGWKNVGAICMYTCVSARMSVCALSCTEWQCWWQSGDKGLKLFNQLYIACWLLHLLLLRYSCWIPSLPHRIIANISQKTWKVGRRLMQKYQREVWVRR